MGAGLQRAVAAAKATRQKVNWEPYLTPEEAAELVALRAKQEELEVVKMQISQLRWRACWRERQATK